MVLIAVAGARRTATSFERLAGDSRSADVLADVGAVDPAIVEQITQLPMVEVSGAVTIVFAIVDGVETDLAIWAPRDARIGTQIERDRIIRGRRPDPGSLDEVIVNEKTVEILGVDVGDEISIATMTPEQVRNEEYFPPRGPRLRVDVVGVVRGPSDLVPSAEGGFITSPAFLDSVHGQVDEWTTYLAVGLHEGATVADFEVGHRRTDSARPGVRDTLVRGAIEGGARKHLGGRVRAWSSSRSWRPWPRWSPSDRPSDAM